MTFLEDGFIYKTIRMTDISSVKVLAKEGGDVGILRNYEKIERNERKIGQIGGRKNVFGTNVMTDYEAEDFDYVIQDYVLNYYCPDKNV